MASSVPATATSAPVDPALERHVNAALVRTAYLDARLGAPFGIVVAVLFAWALYPVFPARQVVPWLTFAVTCNVLRLITRWLYLRAPVPEEQAAKWARWFVAVSAASGLSWGVGAWLFYPAQESVYRIMVVLVLAGTTTGASRLLAPIAAANLSYIYLAIGPLLPRLTLSPDTRSYTLAAMWGLYVAYMTLAARQQQHTLRRTIRLGQENAALVDSLGAAKEQAEKMNRELKAEIARREVMETELRAASERAFAASRAKSEFLATMSHEIRTPMNGIIGMLRIVRDTPLSQGQRDHIETAASSADTLLELLSDILDFSKIEAGRLELENIPFSPTNVVRSVIDLLHSRAAAQGLELKIELDPRLPVGLIGDPNRLRQVLFNLVGNAIKFTNRGTVTLRLTCASLEAASATVGFSVADSGIGIDLDALQRIFRPFTQADNSMSRRFGGSGLGLAISQQLIEAMGSRIEARSEPGRGSTFEFRVRFARATGSETNGNGSAGSAQFILPRLRGRVLVVEDDRVNQRVIRHFLKQMDLDTGLAEDGPAAVEMATGGKWDVVLMDCNLPGMDGLEATRQIRARLANRTLPILALTANVSVEDRADCLAAGMDDFLTKPVRVELLAAALQRHLRAATPVPVPSPK